MAALNYTINLDDINIAASGVRTLFLVTAPTAQRVKIKGLSVYGKGTTNADTPIKVEMFLAASATGGTSTALTPVLNDGDVSETPRSTLATYTAEPTYGTLTQFPTRNCHPQLGFEVYFPMGDEIVLKAGQILGVRATVNQTENMNASLLIEE